MSSAALFGIAVAVVSVLVAYRMGYSAGVETGRNSGFDDGKREGTREGSMRGYAVGYDRARRQRGDEDQPSRSGMRLGFVGFVVALGAILVLALNSRLRERDSLDESAIRQPAAAEESWPAKVDKAWRPADVAPDKSPFLSN